MSVLPAERRPSAQRGRRGPANRAAALPAVSFAAAGVPAPLVAALAAAGITAPFPIQAAALPDALAGRDILGRGQTGSGKTLAFCIPLAAGLTDGYTSAVARAAWVTGRASRLVPDGTPGRLGQDPAGDPVSVPQAS